jgi:hypothetical protein
MKPLNDPPKGRPRGGPPGRFGVAFLLAQVGAHAAWRFAARLAALELAPPHVGILRILGAQPAITQQALAPLWECRADWWRWWTNFETRGLVERRANPDDRPSHALHLTEEGRAMLELSGRVGREHRQALLAALNDDEQGPTRGPAAVRSFTPGYRPDFGLDTARIGRRTG